MAILPILVAPHPVLKKKCTPVEAVDGHIRRVVDCAGRGETPQPMKIINPEIIAASDDLASYEEGCLSFPEQYADVKRPARVTVKYLDETGAEQTLDADGLLATCIQHEIDHLDGVVFVDHISSLKRGMIMRKLQKLMRGKPRPDVAAE